MRRPALDPGSPAPLTDALGPAPTPGKRTLTDQLPGLSAASTGIPGGGHEVPHRAAMEQAFGTSFEHVAAHTGDPARAACDELGASAFAVGSHVAFADASPDRALVAHELTHVLQQGAGAAGPAPQAKGDGGDAAHEAEADAIAAAVASGASVAGRVGSLRGAAAGTVQGKSAAPAHTPAFAQARSALIDARYLVEATWNDVERAPAGDGVRARIARALGAARASVEAVRAPLGSLSDAERQELAPIANALQSAAGRLASKDPSVSLLWVDLCGALAGVFGPGLAQAGIAAAPERGERVALARRALEHARDLLAAEVASPTPAGIANDAVFAQLAIARAALHDEPDQGLRRIVEELGALVRKLEYGFPGGVPSRLRELRAHLGDVEEAAGLPRGSAERMDAVIKAQDDGPEPPAGASASFDAEIANLQIDFANMFDHRKNAVFDVFAQSLLQDPVRPTPLWQTLAMMALEMASGFLVKKALDAFGDAVAVTKAAANVPRTAPRLLDANGRPFGDTLVLFAPDGSVANKPVLAGARDWLATQIRGKSDAAGTGAKGLEAKAFVPAGPHAADPKAAVAKADETPSASDAKPAFFHRQMNAVDDAKAAGEHGLVNLEQVLAPLFRHDPDGVLRLLGGLAGATRTAVAPAEDQQKQATTARYAELVAQSNHGDVQGNIERKHDAAEAALHKLGARGPVPVDVDDRVETRQGMDLRRDVELKANAMNLMNAHFRDDGTGVLSIRLEEASPTAPLQIAKAWIAGLNGPLRDTLARMPIAQMNLAIRVHVPMKGGGHVSFARNPQGELFVEGADAEDWCRARVRSHGGDDRFVMQQAARIVIEQELGPRILGKIDDQA